MFRQITKQLFKTIDSNFSTTTRSLSFTQALKAKEKTEPKAEVKEEPKYIVVEKDCQITLIGINRPQQRNAINSQAAAQLCRAFRDFENDETSPVAVLYGIGGSFCSGFDIFEIGADDREGISMDILMMPEGSVGPTRRHLKKPVVCGISGYCVANGLELALMCDLRVMEETATLGFFNRRFGVPVIDGATARLPAMIGFSRALDLLLTGRHVCAEEAHDIGLVNRLCAPGTSLHNSIELAKILARFPQKALNHDRNSLYSSVFEANTFHSAVQNEIMYTSKEIIDEMQAGIKWFNKTFASDKNYSWLKRDRSMADWDDDDVAEAAAEISEKISEEKAKEEAAAAAAAAAKKTAEKQPPKSPEPPVNKANEPDPKKPSDPAGPDDKTKKK